MLIFGGCILIYIIGKPVLETIQYRLSGQYAEGRVIGFRGRGSSITVFEENTSKHGKKIRSRRHQCIGFRYLSVVWIHWMHFLNPLSYYHG